MKDQTAVMCHNIAKYDRDHNTPEMTAAEAAGKVEEQIQDCQACCAGLDDDKALRFAASILRRVASGELVPVIHAKSIFVNNGKVERWCSRCNHIIPKYADWCPFCGALMDRPSDGEKVGEPDA